MMTERYTELSSYLKRKSRESTPSDPPDLHEEENMVLAMAVTIGISVSLSVAFATVVYVVARGG
jgi:hypothetical protein